MKRKRKTERERKREREKEREREREGWERESGLEERVWRERGVGGVGREKG